MEGVGARLGRSSTRYGPATVFTGPVRKWKKKWVHVASSSSASTSSSGSAAAASNHSHHSQIQTHNGAPNGTNGSHLLLYKWTPITQSQNAAINGNTSNNGSNNGDKVSGKDEITAAPTDEPPRRKFKYIPIALLEEPKDDTADDEAAEKVTDEARPVETDPFKDGNLDEKPDINDVPMEENQDTSQVVRQDLNESTLDLCLGLNAHDGDNDPDSKADS
ncbi:golgin family A protein [Parasponia andersonii]|uniref:Golgin family A protein n=1 Tax=Parasponia andersonii TaxID=3476 RepID=A0A2P5ABW8_PARAD|nr:golgin family A protein [Parasponia andersonii]